MPKGYDKLLPAYDEALKLYRTKNGKKQLMHLKHRMN